MPSDHDWQKKKVPLTTAPCGKRVAEDKLTVHKSMCRECKSREG